MVNRQRIAAPAASDADLVRAADAGDRISLGLLFERYRPRLYGAALRLLGYQSEAEDAVHDTFVTALAHLKELQDPGAVGGWLHAILRNRCLGELRRRQVHREVDNGDAILEAIPGEGSLEARIASRELREWVWNALALMPEAMRVTVLLRYFGSYHSYEDLAAILAVPIGTVRSRLHDAKARLAGLLLGSAGLAGGDAERLNQQRLSFYRHAFADLFFRGGRDAFLAHYADDLQVLWSTGKSALGRHHLDAEIDDDVRCGVQLIPRRVLASGNTTVLEGVFVNPPEHLDHCPPGLALVLFQRRDQVTRVHLHLAPRAPHDTVE